MGDQKAFSKKAKLFSSFLLAATMVSGALPALAKPQEPLLASNTQSPSCFVLNKEFSNVSLSGSWQETLSELDHYGEKEGRALIKSMIEGGVAFCQEDDMPLIVEAYYQPEKHSLHTHNPDTHNVPDAVKTHEMAHALQTNMGLSIEKNTSIHGYIVSKLMAEAGANAITLTIAYKMKENGHDEMWNEFPYDKIKRAFSTAIDEHQDASDSYAMKKATQAAWDAFFKEKNLVKDYMQAALIESVSLLNDGRLSLGLPTHYVSQQTLKATTSLPSGESFLDNPDIPDIREIFYQSKKALEVHLLASSLERLRQGDDVSYIIKDIHKTIGKHDLNARKIEQSLSEWNDYLEENLDLRNFPSYPATRVVRAQPL